MKKMALLLMAMVSMQAYAEDPAVKLKITISGALKDNRYFLCLPNAGCFSVLNGEKGRVVSILHTLDMDGIYLVDANDPHFRFYPQKGDDSCNHDVTLPHTLTISGALVKVSQGEKINNLHCDVS